MKLKEWEKVRIELQSFNHLFYYFIEIINPVLTDKVSTLAVSFDKVGRCLDLRVNPGFWDSLDLTQRVFVTAHELSHLFFCHGSRIQNVEDNPDLQLANIAADLFVNESLLDLGFERVEVDKGFIFADYFKDYGITPDNLDKYSFEDVYFILKEESQNNNGKGQGLQYLDSFDDHGGLAEVPDEFLEERYEEILEKEENLTSSEKDIIKNLPGSDSLLQRVDAKKIKIKRNKAWETIISRYFRFGEDEAEGWAFPNRRFHLLNASGMFLPGKAVDEFINKINVWFFQDCSGSCVDYVHYFHAAASTFPDKNFNVVKHMFDTRVVRSDYAFNGLGTAFDCIQKYIKNRVKYHDENHPDAVFVFTDLECRPPNVQDNMKNKWHWFCYNTYYDDILKSNYSSQMKRAGFNNLYYLKDYVDLAGVMPSNEPLKSYHSLT